MTKTIKSCVLSALATAWTSPRNDQYSWYGYERQDRSSSDVDDISLSDIADTIASEGNHAMLKRIVTRKFWRRHGICLR